MAVKGILLWFNTAEIWNYCPLFPILNTEENLPNGLVDIRPQTDSRTDMASNCLSKNLVSLDERISVKFSKYNQKILYRKNSNIFCDVTPCRPPNINRRFGGTRRLYLQGRRISQSRNQHVVGENIKSYIRQEPLRNGFIVDNSSDIEKET
jgi:hypothetical protein